LANAGINVLESGALDYVPENTFSDFARNVFPALLGAEEKVVGYGVSGCYWSDIGTLEAYKEAQCDALSGKVRVCIPGERRGDLWVDRGSRLHPSAVLDGRAVIGKDVAVGRGATLTGDVTLGSGCQVEPGAVVKRSVLLPGFSRRGPGPLGGLHRRPRLRRPSGRADPGRSPGPRYIWPSIAAAPPKGFPVKKAFL
jgi:mannose-1-phosphate guanylyltransferase